MTSVLATNQHHTPLALLRMFIVRAPSFKPCSSLIILRINPISSSSGQVAPRELLLCLQEDIIRSFLGYKKRPNYGKFTRLKGETRLLSLSCCHHIGIFEGDDKTWCPDCYISYDY